MDIRYEAPALKHYGSLSALTSSSFKCTSGADAFFANRTGVEPAGGNGPIVDPATGEVIDPDACRPFNP